MQKKLLNYTNEDEWTNDEEKFFHFISEIKLDGALPENTSFFFVNLGNLANEYFDERKEGFENAFNRNTTKREFLEFFIRSFKIPYDKLLNISSETIENETNDSLKERRKQAGYYYALISNNDTCILDVIMRLDGCDLNELILSPKNVYTYKEGERLPITINALTVFLKNFYEYTEPFKEVAEGYFLCLIVSYAETLLNDLENNKITDTTNLKKSEILIDKDEKNELIKAGYKKPDENSILSVPQTALLIQYLNDNKILLTNHLGKSKTSKIISILTKHSNNTLRQNLDINRIEEIKNQSENGKQEQYGNLKKIKEALQNIVSIIDKEIENKEKL